jgi:hypothetical protein
VRFEIVSIGFAFIPRDDHERLGGIEKGLGRNDGMDQLQHELNCAKCLFKLLFLQNGSVFLRDFDEFVHIRDQKGTDIEKARVSGKVPSSKTPTKKPSASSSMPLSML